MTFRLRTPAAVVIGSAELPSAIGRALHRAGFAVIMCDDVDPPGMRRGMSYTDAWFLGDAELEETTALFCGSSRSIPAILASREVIAATAWSWCGVAQGVSAELVVDARSSVPRTPCNLLQRAGPAVLTIGVGQGYVAGVNAHAALMPESDNTAHAEGSKAGSDPLRNEFFRTIVVAPSGGRFSTDRRIGDYVMAGEGVGAIGRMLLYAPATGVLSGLTARGARTMAGMPVVEVDTRGQAALCFTIPPWCRAVAENVVRCALEHHEPRAPEERHDSVIEHG